MSNFIVRKVAVLGAGVMGAQIAAHCANADVPVILFDLAAREGDANGIVRKALDGLKKLEPAPLAAKERVAYIDAANYEQHLELLRDCDLIIEAIAEKMEWKRDLYHKVAPFVGRGRDLRQQYLRPVDQRPGRGHAGGAAQPLLRHPFLQSAALHASGRTDSVRGDESATARRPRDLPHHDPGQGRGAGASTRRTSSPTGSACFPFWRWSITPSASDWASIWWTP